MVGPIDLEREGPRDGRPSGTADVKGIWRELEEEKTPCNGRDAER